MRPECFESARTSDTVAIGCKIAAGRRANAPGHGDEAELRRGAKPTPAAARGEVGLSAAALVPSLPVPKGDDVKDDNFSVIGRGTAP
jgi:hypothetical protein